MRPPVASRCAVSLLALALCAGLPACDSGGGSGGGAGAGGPLPNVTLQSAFGGLQFARPVKLVQHPKDADRWYVVEQGGKIWTFLASDPAGTKTLALDLVADLGVNLGNTAAEQGLLGLAFDPSFGPGGKLYITYTDEAANNSILARYQSPDDDGPFTPTADPIVLAIPHAAPNHNAGDIMFGSDNFLYYSMGDAAVSANGQNTSALLGKILRLDVLGPPKSGEKYAVPSTNPFNNGTRPFCDSGTSPAMPAQPCPEIFAWGFRNPWRMNFDRATGDLWVGDVGESKVEEIDKVFGGQNYGWDCMEGDLPFSNAASCSGQNFEPPVVVHDHPQAEAIIGGIVYRGSAIPGLQGFYVYGDEVEGVFFAFDSTVAMPTPLSLSLPVLSVSAFGQDRNGEIYAVILSGNPSIQKLVAAP